MSNFSNQIRIGLFIRGFHYGGIEKVFENYYSNMDLSSYEIHVITHMQNNLERKKIFMDMGCIIHELSRVQGKSIRRKNIEEYKKLFEENRFDVVHNNMAENLLPLFYAKKYHADVRILHAHTDYIAKINNFHKLLLPIYQIGYDYNVSNATILLAVSESAAKSAFGKRAGEALILPNAIDTEKFLFNQDIRKKIRQKYSINDSDLVFGHVGRYESNIKNQSFLIEVFYRYLSAHDNAWLFLIGDGKQKSEIIEKVNTLGISNRVIFTGNVPNVQDYLDGMDIFLFPSKKEGFGIVALEAQTNGLPCLVSDTVTREICVTDLVKFLPIEGDTAVSEWLNAIESTKKIEEVNRVTYGKNMRNSAYNITRQTVLLDEIYKK